MADDNDAVRLDANLDWFPFIVALMINRVGERLLHRCIGIVEETPGFRGVIHFNNLLL